MANWADSSPDETSLYISVLENLRDRDKDAAKMFNAAPTNPEENFMRYNRSSNLFQEYLSSIWTDKVLSLAGGGTGAVTAVAARAALGIGTMGVQNDSAVNITGGSMSGVNIDAASLTSGVIALSRGGTGVSLGIGANGTFLRSNGTVVSFSADGSQLAALNASNLATGTIPVARLNSSQATQGFYGTAIIVTTTDTLTPLIAAVAPLSTSSRFLITGVLQRIRFFTNVGQPVSVLEVSLYRSIGAGADVRLTNSVQQMSIDSPSDTIDLMLNFPINYIDSPATTSTVAYKVYVKKVNATGNPITINSNDLGLSNIAAIELLK